MKTPTCLSLLSIALALAYPAGAQTPSSPGAVPGGSGGQRAVLVPYGPYVTQTGVGAGGADISEIESGFSTFGFVMDASGGSSWNKWRVADEVTIPAGESWDLDSVSLLAYQAGGPTMGSFTSVELDVWDHDPLTGGSPLLSVPVNMLSSQTWTGVFRVDPAFPTDNSRSIIELRADLGQFNPPPLGSGTWWFSVTATGSSTAGPPEATVQVPWDATNNGRQFDPFGAGWIAAVDGGTGKEHGFVFQVEGVLHGGGGVSKFCNSRPSSLPGCVPDLGGPSATLSKGAGPGSYTVSAEPVPGGFNNPGILIYTKNGLTSSPINTAFGELCLSQFLRAPILAFPGGTKWTCDGNYQWDFGGFVAGAKQVSAGDTLHVQGWYRDPQNTAGANFTQGIGPIAVLP